MEEYEWQTFVSEWKEYKRERRLTGEGVLVAELCESMSKRLLMRISQSRMVFPKNESEMLDSIKNLAVTTHPRIQSINLLMCSPPDQFLKTLQGQIPNTSFSLATTNYELLKEIIFCFLIFKFKDFYETDDILALVKENQMQTSEELVAYFQAKEKKKTKRPRRPRSQSRGRSRSRSTSSILTNGSQNKAEEERGRTRMKSTGEESRMMTRSRSRAASRMMTLSRAAGAKSVRIRSPSDGRLQPDLMRDIPRPKSKAKMRWSWICKYCGKLTKV